MELLHNFYMEIVLKKLKKKDPGLKLKMTKIDIKDLLKKIYF